MDANVLDVVLKVTQLIGIPVAIYLYFINKERERLDREYGTYDELDDKYIEYLRLCLEHPDLDVADIPRPATPPLNSDQQHREFVIFSILISIMERAFLMYADKSNSIRRKQWAGWDAYIRDWGGRPNFKRALPTLRTQFDERFLKYLEGL